MAYSNKKTFSKKGDPSDLDNYRGISLLNTIFKLLERLIKMRIDIVINKHNLGAFNGV